MILKSDIIARELVDPSNPKDPMIISPLPNIEELKKSGAASVDLRLGCWFLTCRQNRVGVLNIYEKEAERPTEARLVRPYFVPFGKQFILHPQAFVLGVTLEWIRLPANYAAYVIGRSSWGRRGLIIATATGVHPRFTGCLTLELTNVGEIPIVISPGTTVCQIFIHEVKEGEHDTADQSSFRGSRKPTLGEIELDEIASRLAGLT